MLLDDDTATLDVNAPEVQRLAQDSGEGPDAVSLRDLAQTDERGEFVAFTDYAFGGGGAAGDGAGDDVLGQGAKVGF